MKPSARVCDNSNVIQPRRAIVFLLGIWIGAGILVDFATLNNFDKVDEFLQTPGSVTASVNLNTLGRDNGRTLLRRYAGEANGELLFNWERAGAALGVTLFFLLLFGDDPNRVTLGCVLLMTTIVLGQHFMTPAIAELGRKLDDLPAIDPARSEFGILHGVYSSLEILKALIGLVVAWRLSRKENVRHAMRTAGMSQLTGSLIGMKRG